MRGAGRLLVTLLLLLAAGAGVLYLLREQPFDVPSRQQRDLSRATEWWSTRCADQSRGPLDCEGQSPALEPKRHETRASG